MSIPQETIQQIRDRVNLADLISETVQLKRSGRSLTGLCPFHSEKSPSFSVNSEEGFYHCFGCSKHGSAFDFVMETRGLTFVEAVKFLGSRVGIEVSSEAPEKSEQRKREEERRRQLRAALREVTSLYQERLQHEKMGAEARAYLSSRGVSAESISLFQLGLCSDSSSGIEEVISRCMARLSLERSEIERALLELGVLGRRDDGTLYEAFRGRLIFPIFRSDGVPVALGGRILEANSNRPKYINSKESPIYQKRQTLYGLSHALPYLRKEREALLVEGYLDVIALAQAGFPAAIATCGTSVTTEHAELLRRFCERLVCVFDADSAGRKAASNCFEIFLNSGIEVFGLSLPNGEDPGSFLIGKRADELGALAVQKEFEQLLESHKTPILSVYLNYHLEQTDRGASALGRISTEFIRTAKRIKNPVEREATLRNAAPILGVSVESLNSLGQGMPTKVVPPSSRPATQSRPQVTRAPEQKLEQRQAKAAPPPKRNRSRVNVFLEQMLISIITEPSLSGSLLQMNHSLRDLVSEEFSLERLRSFLMVVDRSDFVSLENFRGREKTKEFKDLLEKWNELLNGEGLDAKILLAKAWNQVVVGGAAPKKLVDGAERFSLENTIHAQVERIRVEERSGVDSERKEDLVQQKLLEKRSLFQASRRGIS